MDMATHMKQDGTWFRERHVQSFGDSEFTTNYWVQLRLPEVDSWRTRSQAEPENVAICV